MDTNQFCHIRLPVHKIELIGSAVFADEPRDAVRRFQCVVKVKLHLFDMLWIS